MDLSRAWIAITLLLGGCAAPPWVRPDENFSRAQAERDEARCRALAERELSLQGQGFYGPPGELYGQNFEPTGRTRPQLVGPSGPMFDIDPVRRTLEEDRIADDCMRSKGYTRARGSRPCPAGVQCG